MKCPICGQELVVKHSDYLDGYVLLEKFEDCPAGHYFEEYLYGLMTVGVGGKYFRYSYTQSTEELSEHMADVDAEVKAFKERQKRKTIFWSTAAALILPFGFVLVPLYHVYQKRKRPKE